MVNCKLKIVCLFIVALLLTAPSFVGALEVGFPEVGGYSPDETSGPAEWIRYIYLLSMGLVGLALIYTFARAGIERMSGGMNPGAISSANKRIKDGMIGLLILLGSYLFLREINPALVTLNSPKIEASEMKSPFDFFLELYFPSQKRQPLFMGYEIGHACQSPTDCKEGLTCEDNKCIEGEKSSAIVSCSNNTPCPSDRRCFSDIDLSKLIDNTAVPYSGTCSSLKAFGEDCDTSVAVACRGIGIWCDPSTKKCDKQ